MLMTPPKSRWAMRGFLTPKRMYCTDAATNWLLRITVMHAVAALPAASVSFSNPNLSDCRQQIGLVLKMSVRVLYG
jgi:hypothetical protein